jgi:hypothetical protein
MSSATLGFLLTQMVKAPLLVVYIVGIVLAFIRYSTQGRPMLLAGCGFFASHLVELAGLILIMLALFSRPAMHRS